MKETKVKLLLFMTCMILTIVFWSGCTSADVKYEKKDIIESNYESDDIADHDEKNDSGNVYDLEDSSLEEYNKKKEHEEQTSVSKKSDYFYNYYTFEIDDYVSTNHKYQIDVFDIKEYEKYEPYGELEEKEILGYTLYHYIQPDAYYLFDENDKLVYYPRDYLIYIPNDYDPSGIQDSSYWMFMLHLTDITNVFKVIDKQPDEINVFLVATEQDYRYCGSL